VSAIVIIAIVVVVLVVGFIARRGKQRKHDQRALEAAGHRQAADVHAGKVQEHEEKATELEDKL
jgi:ABC-type lipoprotein release transport system permease subunit